MLRPSGNLLQACLKDFGVDQRKWHHQAKSCCFTQVSPATPQAGGQQGYCVLWSASLYRSELFPGKAASSGSIEKHMYVLCIHAKIKNFIDNQWNSWFGLISILVCKPACLYWHALWSQQYNFWPTLAPRITLTYSMILSKRHHNTHKEPGPSCWLTHALTLLLGFAKNARAKLVSGKV